MTTPPEVLDEAAVIALASELDRARQSGTTLDRPFTSRPGGLGLGDAYRVQAALTSLRRSRGARLVGHKLGYTSEVMRRQMGVDAPNHGPLTDAMRLADGARVPGSALQPRVEPEIALVLAAPVDPGAGVDDVLEACSHAVACLEVVDSVWAGYRFALEDNTADGSSAGWFVRGPRLPLTRLDEVAVELSVDDRVVGAGVGADAGGHPALTVAWLATALAGTGHSLRAGDVVLTGGLTAAVPLAPGSVVSAAFHSAEGTPTTVSVRGPHP